MSSSNPISNNTYLTFTTSSSISDFLKKTPFQNLINWGRKNSLWFLTQPLGCCGIEIICTAAPHYDFDRFGIIPRSSPRQADVMIISGWISKKYLPSLKLLWEQMPEPKWVVAMGECAISGGPFWESYSTINGIEKIFPVDVYIPGCPPKPEQLIKGFMELQRKISQKKDRSQLTESEWKKQQWPDAREYEANYGVKKVPQVQNPTGISQPSPLPASQMLLHLGPQHPLQPGPFLLNLTIEGETVKHAELSMGYNHRSLEKILENRTYSQCIPLTDRICYLASISNNEVFCAGVEKLMDIEPPLRAQYIRTIMLELSRLQSHMLGIGEYAADLGFLTMFLYMIRDREDVVSLMESVTGGRLNHSFVRIGGVACDFPDGFRSKTLAALKKLRNKIIENDELLSKDGIYLNRTKGIGVLKREDAMHLGVSGPVLRASNVDYDIRKVEPHLIYEELDFKVATRKEGDVYARVKVRFDEMLESISIIEQALDAIPVGPINSNLNPYLIVPPPGEAYTRVEDPRGEMAMYIVSDGTHRPQRVKIRGPAFANMQALPPLFEGVPIADMVAITASMDACTSEVDR